MNSSLSDSSKNIRNFCIIAHIDHGKSTLSDRIIEKTTALLKKEMKSQMLDSLEIERERGITVKSAAVSLNYQAKDGEEYTFNLIDTPGHVDFNYEVSRSLTACEGALLLVDATQGIRAQTLANFYLAFDADLVIVPVINKIDLPAAEIEMVQDQMKKELAFDEDELVKISAKSGVGIDELMEKVVEVIPAPKTNTLYNPKSSELKALIFDSFFDIYRGVVVCIRVFSGELKAGDEVKLFFTEKKYVVEEVGLIKLKREKKASLSVGEVGYLILGIKTLSEIKIGDTVTLTQAPCSKPCPGYKEVKPMVFAGVFPIDNSEYENLKVSMEKLQLNDSALHFEKENSIALGFGFRCGFLGLLHMEIFQERLLSEFDMAVLLTAPSVAYKITLKKGEKIEVDNPSHLPDPNIIERIDEPYVKATIITPSEYLGNVMNLVQEKRGIQSNLTYLDQKRIEAIFELPLAEVILDFFDQLKSVSKGYASLDYDLLDYRPSDIIKVEVMVNKEIVDALSFLVHREKARFRAKTILERLKEEIPRHMFQIPLQAAVGATIIARENIPALRKDVTAKCYGGDISRKRKLLEKQKEGKKKMKSFGKVDIPQKAFINVLRDKNS